MKTKREKALEKKVAELQATLHIFQGRALMSRFMIDDPEGYICLSMWHAYAKGGESKKRVHLVMDALNRYPATTAKWIDAVRFYEEDIPEEAGVDGCCLDRLSYWLNAGEDNEKIRAQFRELLPKNSPVEEMLEEVVADDKDHLWL